MKKFIKVNDGFICEKCGKTVEPTKHDTYRNHCPFCLYSKHVDINPGDRMNDCLGLMQPIAIETGKKGSYKIVYRCLKCHAITRNKMANKSIVQPDDFQLCLQIIKNSVTSELYL